MEKRPPINLDLLKVVVEQIEKDASHGDYTAIEELLTIKGSNRVKELLSRSLDLEKRKADPENQVDGFPPAQNFW